MNAMTRFMTPFIHSVAVAVLTAVVLLTAVTALEPALIASAGTLPSAPSPLFPHTLAGVSTGNERGLARAAAVF